MIDILKNPIIIAIIAGALTYAYIQWSQQNKYKRDMSKKELKELKKSWSYAPIVVFVITLALSYLYFNQNVSDGYAPMPNIDEINNLKLIKDVSSESAKSFHLIGKGLNIPNSLPEKMPDVFLETL